MKTNIKKEENKQSNLLKDRITNNLMTTGNKPTCEKLVLLSFKSFQKNFYTDHKSLTQLAIINTTPIFLLKHIRKLKRKRKEKKIPFLPRHSRNRIALALKNIITDVNNKKTKNFSLNFKNDLLLCAQKKGLAVEKKNIMQNEITERKKYRHFKWF